MRIQHLLLFILMITCGSAIAQESLVDLTYNAALAERAKRAELQQQNAVSKYSVQALADTLALPFLDDFSGEDVYPDTNKWLDKRVYVNRTFPKAPPTLGVATFDGLQANGLAYNMNVTSGSSGYADTLTSKKINLSAVTDSVYFSFFYQAQGRGNAPEAQDSLILQFKRPNDTTWVRVWAKAGYQLPGIDSTFNYVHLYVPDSFYYATFQFRFLNRATLSGNVDHWHIDYVYMNRPRTFNETGVFNDVAFVYPTTKLLKNYHAMPYDQYTPAEFDSTFWNPIRNNGSIATNVTYRMFVRNENGSVIYAHPGETGNVDPYSTTAGYTSCSTTTGGCGQMLNVTTENFTAGYPMPADCTYFTVTQKVLQSTADLIPSNDSVRSIVNFHNYYAYDDGSAEAAWGISSSFSMVAYKFTLTNPDTLRAVSIFWNPYASNIQSHGVRITVWNAGSNEPGTILYQTAVKYPVYHEGYNGFQYYMLDTILNLSGTFYVGYMQIDPETLSVGMDMNTNVQSKIFYNTNGNWLNTSYKAAMMMRPHLGEAFTITGVNENKPKPAAYKIYPNPANDRVYISGNNNEPSKVNVIDAYGRQVMAEQLMTGEHSLDVSMLSSGMYFIRIENAGNVSAHRVVISR